MDACVTDPDPSPPSHPRRELLQAGFIVRAGVRDVEKGKQSLQVASQYGIITSEQLKRVQVVEFDLTDVDTITPAIGNANKVRCCRCTIDGGASAALSCWSASEGMEP